MKIDILESVPSNEAPLLAEDLLFHEDHNDDHHHVDDVCYHRLLNSMAEEDNSCCVTAAVVSNEEKSLMDGPLIPDMFLPSATAVVGTMEFIPEDDTISFQDMSYSTDTEEGDLWRPTQAFPLESPASGGTPSFHTHNDPDPPDSTRACPGYNEIQPATFSSSEVQHNAFFFILSRGGTVGDLPGNRRLRRIINLFAETYVQAQRSERGDLKNQVFDLCHRQFEFVIQKKSFMRFYQRDAQKESSGRRQLSKGRVRSILETNGGMSSIAACADTDYMRVGESCALDVIGHLLRDAANEFRRSKREKL